MPQLRRVERVLNVFGNSTNSRYVCRACRVQAIRQFHSSNHVAAAGDPWMQRIKNTLFGSKESKDAEARRERAIQAQIEKQARQSDREKRLRIKLDDNGKQYEVAAFVSQRNNEGYVPASTGDELESVGSEEWVRARADPGEQYIGFLPQKRVKLTDEQWQKLLHHVTVEVLTVREAGRDVSQVCLPGGRRKFTRTRGTAIVVDKENGDASLLYSPLSARQEILECIPKAASEERASSPIGLSTEMTGAVADGRFEQYPENVLGSTTRPSWMQVSLSDPNVKFTILKRVTQLTGHRIPDPILSASTTLADLYDAFKTKEKPKKLVQTAQLQRMRTESPNVAVHATRRTPIHKEKQIGRWKVIEDELRARDLPITGSRHRGARSTVP